MCGTRRRTSCCGKRNFRSRARWAQGRCPLHSARRSFAQTNPARTRHIHAKASAPHADGLPRRRAGRLESTSSLPLAFEAIYFLLYIQRMPSSFPTFTFRRWCILSRSHEKPAAAKPKAFLCRRKPQKVLKILSYYTIKKEKSTSSSFAKDLNFPRHHPSLRSFNLILQSSTQKVFSHTLNFCWIIWNNGL